MFQTFPRQKGKIVYVYHTGVDSIHIITQEREEWKVAEQVRVQSTAPSCP